jgi:hypothetical protein
MENALTLFVAPETPLDPTAVIESAMAARLAYEEAVNSDGTSAASWQLIADDMHATADQLERIGTLRGVVTCHRDRAVDASHRAQFARRMLDVARSARVIDMAPFGSAS